MPSARVNTVEITMMMHARPHSRWEGQVNTTVNVQVKSRVQNHPTRSVTHATIIPLAKNGR